MSSVSNKPTTTTPLPTLNTGWDGNRVHLTINMDQPRHARLQKLAQAYSEIIGRPVSQSLLMIRALDLLHDRLDGLTDPVDVIAERLALVGPARHPLKYEDDS